MRARRAASAVIIAVILLATGLGGSEAQALSLTVVDSSGRPVEGFRWQLEEDTTLPVVPGVRSNDIPSLTIHGSYSPVVAKGSSTTSVATIDVPANKRYLVSVLPLKGHTLSGTQVAVGQALVTVVVNTEPIPTAQISVLVFHDRQPINNAPDIPAEPGLAGFSVVLSDALGQVSQDAFGNPLGTTYQQNADGSFVLDSEGLPVVAQPGSGVILTDAAGEALIRFLPPGKYGVRAVPPIGTDWVQTATIEGTPTVDAWVKAGEPPYFSEWGTLDHHAFIGFVRPMRFPAPPTGPVGTLTGRVVYVHENRPPLQPGLNPGVPVEECWVGLNALGGADEQVYSQPCGPGGGFTIENVPPGVYQLVMWDLPLDAIIDFRTLTVPPGGGVLALGDVSVYAWFGFLEGSVFYDANANGYRELGEAGIPNQALNLRFPDGSLYKATITDPTGRYRFKEVFPFFHWLVAEVDYTRYKPTGMTAVIDEGGPLPPGARSTPQPQPVINPNTGDNLSRTESGEVLTQAMLLYAGQTHRMDWGKVAYGRTENGGISGIVHYATTRAENDPRYAVGDDWEPKVPRVQVNLYSDTNGDTVIDDLNGDGRVTPADVDNAPFDDFPGPGDVDRNGDGTFTPGDALNVIHTDSWDDSRPTGCVGPPQLVHGQPVRDCAETLRTWSQLRPGVFDGGYLFSSYFPGGMGSGSSEVQGLPPGLYVVEANRSARVRDREGGGQERRLR